MIIPVGLLGGINPITFISNANTDNSGGATTTLVCNVPAGKQSGDIMIAVMGSGPGGTTPSFTVSTGWTKIGTDLLGSNRSMAVAWRRADGTGSDTLTWTSSTNQFMTCSISLWRNGHASQAPEAGVAVATLNPPSLTPSWGAALGMFVAGAVANSTGTFNSYPSGYTGIAAYIPGTTSAAIPMVCTAYLQSSNASEDPGSFSITSGGNQGANTAAVRSA